VRVRACEDVCIYAYALHVCMCARVSGSNKCYPSLSQSRGTVGRRRGVMDVLLAIVDKKSGDDAICSRCGSNDAAYIPDGTPPICMECIDAPYRRDWRRAVAENSKAHMGELIRKCGKTADVQLKLPHDAHVIVAAFLWSRWPWYGANRAQDAELAAGSIGSWTLGGDHNVPVAVAGSDYAGSDSVGCGCCSQCPCCGCSCVESCDSASDMTDAVSASDISETAVAGHMPDGPQPT
jgi:hypothetical protein